MTKDPSADTVRPVAWLAVATVALIMLILGTFASPGGLGISDQTSIKIERDRNWKIIKYSTEKNPGKTMWDWLGLIGVPMTLAGLGIWFQSQEQKRAIQDAEQQRRLAAEESKEETLQRYLDRVSNLLLEKLHIPGAPDRMVIESASDVIRARTLSVLRSFSKDGERKGSVIFFLIETDALQGLNVSLHKSNLSGAYLSEANLSGTRLSEADLREANLSEANLSGAALSGANLIRTNLKEANISKGVLSEADLREAQLSGADLSDANLSGADLSRSELDGAIFCEANLSGALLTAANLSEANLTRSNLTGADFCQANLTGAKLIESDLSEADLSETDLSGANLSGANLSGACLRNANLSEADLSKTNLSCADLEGVKWNRNTKWPDHSRFEESKNIPRELLNKLVP